MGIKFPQKYSLQKSEFFFIFEKFTFFLPSGVSFQFKPQEKDALFFHFNKNIMYFA